MISDEFTLFADNQTLLPFFVPSTVEVVVLRGCGYAKR